MTPTIHPYRRFFARVLDMALVFPNFAYLLYLTVQSRHPHLFFIPGFVVVYQVYLACSLLVFEPWLVSQFGFTPGKWVFGLRVLKKDGGRLTYREALARTWKVVFFGMGLGVQILNVVMFAVQFFKLRTNRESSWDKALESACLPKRAWETPLP